MGTYICSDIHGNYKGLFSILEDIKFNDNDKLIIAGDIIDRGYESAELIEFVLDNDNVELLLGNHELLFMKAFRLFPELYSGKAYSSRAKKFEETYLHYLNGGKTTMDSLRRYNKYTDNNRNLAYEFYKYLENAKLYRVINDVIISHTGTHDIENIEDSVWDRDFWVLSFNGEKSIVGKNVIGHSTVGVRYLITEEGSNYFSFILENNNGDFILNIDGSDRNIIPLYNLDTHKIYFKVSYNLDEYLEVSLQDKKVTKRIPK